MATPMIPSETLAETMMTTRHLDAPIALPLNRWMNGLTAAVTALSLLLATVAPAHADRRSDDFAKAIAAIAALALIGTAIQNNRHDRPREEPRHHPLPPAEQPRPRESHAPRVPQVCAIEVEGRDRDYSTVFAESCLRDEGFRYELPRYCARQVRIYGRTDRVYPEGCLRDAGFRTNGRGYY